MCALSLYNTAPGPHTKVRTTAEAHPTTRLLPFPAQNPLMCSDTLFYLLPSSPYTTLRFPAEPFNGDTECSSIAFRVLPTLPWPSMTKMDAQLVYPISGRVCWFWERPRGSSLQLPTSQPPGLSLKAAPTSSSSQSCLQKPVSTLFPLCTGRG